MVTKEILSQYSNLKKEYDENQSKIERLEKQINKIESDGAVIDKVMGGDGGLQSFKIEGFPYPEYSRKKTALYARKTILVDLECELHETLTQVEEFIASVDNSLIRRIINLRFVENKTWNQVADAIGGNTEDSVRKMFERFMEKS